MPRLSVIMPVYNTKEEYLREAIESILIQTFADFEFVIINDGSTNNAEEVILSYKDTRIKYLKHEKNMGPSFAINRGISVASGEYLIRMDADDISLPERFEKHVNFMYSNPQIDISGTWILKFPQKQFIKLPLKHEEIKKFLLLSHNPIGGATVIFRKTAIEKLNIKYDENITVAEDLELWLRLKNKVTFANLPDSLYKYRVHVENSSIKHSETLQKTTAILIAKARSEMCGINPDQEVEIMYKLIEKKQLSSDEVLILFNNIKLTFEKLNERFPNLKYSRKSAALIKNAVKLCKKDRNFLKILFKLEFYKLLSFGAVLKIFQNSIFYNV